MSAMASTAPATPRHRREWVVVSLCLMALSFAATWWHWTWHLDQAVYDAAQSTWQRPPAPDILIVAIDDASVQAVGRWPWRRAVHAQALKLISEGGPKSILLDLLLSEPDAAPEQDALLAKAMSDAGKVVLPVSHVLDGIGQGHELRPIAPYLSAAKLAHADAALDMDGAVRRAYLWAGSQAHSYPHPALAMLDVAGELPASLPAQPAWDASDTAPTHWHRQSPMPIPYLGPPGRVAHVSYAALLRGEVPPGTFKGRHVLIGVTAHGIGETFQTPVSPMGEGMSGVEVIGQFLDALRQGVRIRSLPPWAEASLSALLILGLLWSFRRATPRRALLSSLGLAFGAVLAAWALMAAGCWWPPFGLVLGALLSYPVWSWRRLEATARELEAELRTIAAEPPTPGLSEVPPAQAAMDSPPPPADFMQQRTDAISQAGAQLRQARQLLAHTLSALPDAVFVVNAAHVITQVNQQACLMTGYGQPAALLGKRLGDALSPLAPSDAPTWDLLLDKVRHSRLPQTTSASHPRGRQYLVALVATDADLPHRDSEAGAIVCATDVTALQEAELQRAELLGFIAHDIRSPQASLISLVDLHRIGGSMPMDETLRHVESMARHTLELCEELLQVMRAETRAISPEQGDLIKLASDCLSEMQLLARTKDIGLHGNWRENSQHVAVFDDYLVHRALTNLLSNAIKFSPKGGQVSVEVSRNATHHVVAVRDQGPGIPDSELGRLFKRYERVEQGRPSKLAAGIGLGLVFIDTVARRHGGLVKVINKPGEGACFELWLPIDLGLS